MDTPFTPSNEGIEVAVDAPLMEPLTYKNRDNPPCARGTSVIVPLGSRKVKAVVLGFSKPSGEYELKPIETTDPSRPALPDRFIRWAQWLSKYYLHPIGQVINSAFPPLKRLEKERASKKSPVVPQVETSSPPDLTEGQKSCYQNISSEQGFNVHLLHGVTGSGKTEVYLHLIEDVLQQGQQALVLVPEISLTPQLIARFSARFPDQVAVIHSHLTSREKTNQWWEVVEGNKKILVGARSAMFCPLDNLGLIVIDEEHEPSFKQEEKLKYHARDAAVMLAKIHDCPIVLGSATPSLESWHNAQLGKYKLHQMKNRVSERKMPEITVVDMRQKRRDQKREKNENTTIKESDLPFWLSEELFEKMKHTYEQGEQTALFLNRRGVAQTTQCSSCGYVYECPNCAISLTLHGKRDLVCHYCNYTDRLGDVCPQCHEGDVTPLGLGTELVESDIQKLFPDAVVARADRDEIQNREDLEDLILRMETGQIQFLIGTQMIAKGLDFPFLRLVGMVMADVGFNLPDFRTSERSFQLLTQVAGRSGRHGEKIGQVVIQTYNPEHVSITFTQQNDYEGFAEHELQLRQELHYPPFGRLASLRIQGMHHDRVERASDTLQRRAMHLKEIMPEYDDVSVLGPTPSPIAKLRGKFRYLLLLKGPNAHVINQYCRQLVATTKWAGTGVKIQVDIDPLNML